MGKPRVGGKYVIGTAVIALMCLPVDASAQVTKAIGPVLRWIGEHAFAIGVDVVGGELVKKAFKLEDCADCEKELLKVEAELERQQKEANQHDSVIATELAGVRAELESLRAMREQRLEEARREYQTAARLLSAVPELREEVNSIKAEVDGLKAANEEFRAKLQGLDDRVVALERNSRSAAVPQGSSGGIYGGGTTQPRVPAVGMVFSPTPFVGPGWPPGVGVIWGHQPMRRCAAVQTMLVLAPSRRLYQRQICVHWY